MSIRSRHDLEGLRAVGTVVALALKAMKAVVAPGVSTGELDAVAAGVFRSHAARSAPKLVYGFPGAVCISVNAEAVHGVPRPDRTLQAGDLVSLDVTAELDGYMADAAVTVPVGAADRRALALRDCAERAFTAGLEAAAGASGSRAIGRAIEAEVERDGFRVLRQLAGHGIGRTIHEPPTIANYASPENARLTPGLVFTIEPIIAEATRQTRPAGDGWTLATADGSLSAHHEHTVVLGERGQPPMILTAE